MLASHIAEVDIRWKHEYRNFQFRLWSWKHRVICEDILSHRLIAGGLSQASAASSWCWRHTLPKLTQDGNTNIEIFKFGSDRENIRSFVRASLAIVWSPVDFLRLRQHLRELGQNLWHVKKFPEDNTMVGFRVEFVSPSCPSWGHRDGILTDRAVFVFTSCDHRCYRAIFDSRKQYEGNKKVPDCLRKATRLREALALPSWSLRTN